MTVAVSRDRTSKFGTSVRATTKVADPSAEPSELQIRRMNMKIELEIRRMELEEREREFCDRQHQLELRRVKLEAGLAGTEPAQSRPPPFRVDTAVKPIPKFNEHDIESFLISFEKIAELNAFPKDKYAAVLQAHLTEKALEFFTKLSVQQCQEYNTLKEALPTAYSIVPEVYRKRFRGMTMNHHETFSEFTFRLPTQFKKWFEGKKAYDKIERLRELFMMEKFQNCIDGHLRIACDYWIKSQRPWPKQLSSRISTMQYIELAVGIGSRMRVNSSRWRCNHGLNHLQVPWLLHKAVRSRRNLRRKLQHFLAPRLCVITAKSLDVFLLIAKSVLPS